MQTLKEYVVEVTCVEKKYTIVEATSNAEAKKKAMECWNDSTKAVILGYRLIK